jgi:GNAT superfamily N-acetyltransferase
MSGTIIKARSPEDLDAVKTLVWEFFDFLSLRYPEMSTEMQTYIVEQDVSGQLANFSSVFLPPKGECFLARHNEKPVGIVMLKRVGTDSGELNRMYVRDAARGLGLGRKLAIAALDEARAYGLKTLKLDAIYRHVEALKLYESLGFKRYTDANAFLGNDARFIQMALAL